MFSVILLFRQIALEKRILLLSALFIGLPPLFRYYLLDVTKNVHLLNATDFVLLFTTPSRIDQMGFGLLASLFVHKYKVRSLLNYWTASLLYCLAILVGPLLNLLSRETNYGLVGLLIGLSIIVLFPIGKECGERYRVPICGSLRQILLRDVSFASFTVVLVASVSRRMELVQSCHLHPIDVCGLCFVI